MYSAGPDSLCGAGRTGDALFTAPMRFGFPQTLRMPFREAAAPLLADPRFYLCGASFVLNFRHVTGIKGRRHCWTMVRP